MATSKPRKSTRKKPPAARPTLAARRAAFDALLERTPIDRELTLEDVDAEIRRRRDEAG